MKILVIEDDEKIAAFIAQGLREKGFAIDVVHDGDEGADRALSFPYDAAVIDIMLPGTDGLRIVESMRARKILDRTAASVVPNTSASSR